MSWRPSISWPRLLAIGGWLAVVAVALHLTSGPFWRLDPGALYARAVEAIRGGDDAKALDLLEKAAARDSTDAGVFKVKGFTELRLERAEASAASFEQALRLVPHDPEASLGLAGALLRQDRTDSARIVLQEMAGQTLLDSQASRRAQLLEAAGDPGAALDAYAQIADPENLEHRAALALRAERFDAAVPLLRALLAQRPDHPPEIRKDLAYALERAGQRAAALREYAALANQGELDDEARVRYAWLLNSQGRHAAAWRVLAPLPRPSPDPDVLELQAKTAAWAGRLDEASALADAWRDRDPSSAGPGILLADIARERERRARADVERRAAAYPRSGDPDQVEADTAALGVETIDQALWHYAQLLEHRPSDRRVLSELDLLWRAARRYLPVATPQALKDLGTRLESMGHFERAARAYEAAVRPSPDPELLLRIGRMYRWMSQPENAVPWFERYVAAVGPGGVSASDRVDIAQAYLEVGRGEEALLWIEPVLDRGAADSTQLVLGARAATAAGRPDLAVSYLERLERRSTLSIEQQLWLAGQYRADGRAAAALARYETVVQAMDAPPDSLEWTVGDLRAATGDYQGAVGAYGVDRGEVPDPVRVRAAFALQQLGRWDDAIGLYRAHLSAQPDDVDARLALARALARIGKAKEALVHYQRVIEARGPDGLGLEVAQASLAAEDPRAAVRWARHAVEEDGWEAELALATALRLDGDGARADRLFDRLNDRPISTDSAALWQGRIARARGRLLEAYQLFERAAAPGAPGFDRGALQVLLGETALERRDYGRAEAAFEKARALGADSIRLDRALAILDSALTAEFGVPAGLADDNNAFEHREIGVRAAFWPSARLRMDAAGVRSELEQTLAEFQVTSAFFSIGNLFLTPSLEAEVRVGIEAPDDGDTSASGRLGLAYRLRDESVLGVRGARDPVWRAYRPGRTIRHHRILDLGAVGPSLYVNQGQVYLDKNFSRHRLRLEAGGAGYSDDNRQLFAYGHFEFPIEVGLRRRSVVAPNVYVETFEDQVGEYFSPNRYVALGLRGQTLRRGRMWRFAGEVNPHYFDDDDASGFGLEALVEGGVRLGPIWAELGVFFFAQDDGYRTFSLSLEAVVPLGQP